MEVNFAAFRVDSRLFRRERLERLVCVKAGDADRVVDEAALFGYNQSTGDERYIISDKLQCNAL